MPTPLPLANLCRKIARIGSIITILLGIPFLLFVGLQIFSGERANPTIYISLFLLAGLIAGMVIAWRREDLGAVISLASIAGYFFLDGTFPGVGKGQGFPLFAGPLNLLFALIIPGYHPEMSPEAKWVSLISWALSILPVALFLASWWLRRWSAPVASNDN